MLTKDRLGAALAIVAGVVGLVLVFTFHQPDGDADDNARPGTSQVQPAQDDDDVKPAAPGAPAEPAQPAPGQPAQQQAPAPGQPPAGDTDGDDDGN